MKKLLLLVLCLVLVGCAIWLIGEVRLYAEETKESLPEHKKIIITEEDIPDREYEEIGEITAETRIREGNSVIATDFSNGTVTGIPAPAQTRIELAREELQKEAQKVGADAVIFVTYSLKPLTLIAETVKATGKAVRFIDKDK